MGCSWPLLALLSQKPWAPWSRTHPPTAVPQCPRRLPLCHHEPSSASIGHFKGWELRPRLHSVTKCALPSPNSAWYHGLGQMLPEFLCPATCPGPVGAYPPPTQRKLGGQLCLRANYPLIITVCLTPHLFPMSPSRGRPSGGCTAWPLGQMDGAKAPS